MDDVNRTRAVEVLIVEDSATQSAKLRYLIEREGYRTRVAGNGRIALEMIEQAPPDLVLTDIVMPEMDGYALCRAVKSNPALASVPVVLVTTLADARDVVRGLECGADNFIRKPYDEKLLFARIEHVLANQALRKGKNPASGVDLYLDGEHYFIDSDRRQILDLLISSYQQAVQVNEELEAREQQIRELNVRLAQHAAALLKANDELGRKNEALKTASQLKSRFLASASHELRTPLNAILGCSNLLKEGIVGDLNPEQMEQARDIFDSGQHLLSLITDLLDLAKIEAGRMELNLEPTDVGLLLQGSLQSVRQRAAEHGIGLHAAIDDEVGVARVDARKVKQIVLNLLSNAVKFTPDGGRVEIEARRVGEEGEPMLRLDVRDTGIGISEADLPRLFQPFEQLNAWTERRSEGTGLGLALVKELAELHGGRVAVSSEAGKGTCFTVFLPLLAVPEGGLARR